MIVYVRAHTRIVVTDASLTSGTVDGSQIKISLQTCNRIAWFLSFGERAHPSDAQGLLLVYSRVTQGAAWRTVYGARYQIMW